MATRPGDKRLYDQLAQFYQVGTARKFFVGAQREAYAKELADWLLKFKAAMNPAALTDAQRKQIAPLLSVFGVTHRRVLGLTLLLRGMAIEMEQEEALGKEIPSVTVGDDEEEDLARLEAWPAIFTKLFGAKLLPAPLVPSEVTAQVAAHKKAETELPTTTAGQLYRGSYKTLKALRAKGIEDQKRMHSMLDGDFGTEDAAYEAKHEYGYDRRLKGGGPNRHRRQTDPAHSEPAQGSTSPGTQTQAPQGSGTAPGGQTPAQP